MDLWNEIAGDDWKERIVKASVPLWKYENGIPIANASACLIDYAGCRFLLSIAHASIANSEWNFEIKSAEKMISGEWTTVLQPMEMNFLTEFRMLPEIDDFTEPKIVDFTYRKIPNNTTSYHVILKSEDSLLGAFRTVFQPNFDIKPSPEKKYGFYGNIKFSGTDGRRIVFEHRLEHELIYTREVDGHHVFKLPHKYGSHANYQGCSGAPIIDEEGNLVSLVSFGKKSTNSIHGVNINKYRAALDIESKP